MISERIRHLRKNVLGLTQQAFAAEIKISRSNLGNIETGEVAVTERLISSICDKYDVNEEWLRNGTGEIFIELSLEEEIAEFIGRVLAEKEDSFKKRYIDMLSKLDDDGWAALEKIAESMAALKKD